MNFVFYVIILFTASFGMASSPAEQMQALQGCYKIYDIKGYAEPGVQDPKIKSEARFKDLEDFTDLEGQPLQAFQFIGYTVLSNRTVYSTYYFPCVIEKSGGVVEMVSANEMQCGFQKPVLRNSEKFYFELYVNYLLKSALSKDDVVEVSGRARLKTTPEERRSFYKFAAKFKRVTC